MIPTVPEYLSQLLSAQYGGEKAGKIADGFAAKRGVSLRANPLKTTIQQVKTVLQENGIVWQEMSWYADALYLSEATEAQVQALPFYEEGAVYLQGLSAMVPALLLAPGAGANVLDMCAAPGGKTTQLAALSGNMANITACEKNKIRAERLQFNIDRQGAKHVQVMNEDARQLNDFFRFDRILLDAPCTGSGTILLQEGQPQRRMEPAWVKKTIDTQMKMMQKALRMLSKGGEMVYSTCSILEGENEDVVRFALSQGCELVPIASNAFAPLEALPTTLPGTLVIAPNAWAEGFFVAKLKKTR